MNREERNIEDKAKECRAVAKSCHLAFQGHSSSSALALGLSGTQGLWRDRALLLGFLIFGLLTVVADVGLTHAGVYTYDPRFNAGLLIGRMPLEDLAYGLALYLVAVTTWRWEGQADG